MWDVFFNSSVFFCFRDLSYNEITSVPADSVSSLPYLRILQLDNNKINCIDKNAFTGNKKLFNRLFGLLCSMKNDAMLRLSDVPRPLYLYRHGYKHFLNGLRCAGQPQASSIVTESSSLFRTAPVGLPHPPHQQPDQLGQGGHQGPAQAPEPQAGAQQAAV